MSLLRNIAAGVLAGSILAGGATAGYRNSESNFDSTYRTLTSESRSDGYRNYIQSYIRGLQSGYGDLLPRSRSLKFAFDSEASDHQLFSEAMELYSIAMQNYTAKYSSSNRKDSEERQYHLVPHISYDGSVHFTDMNGHGKLKLVKNANGLYSYIGPEKLFEVMGGRGLASTFVQNLEDNDFFHSLHKKAA